MNGYTQRKLHCVGRPAQGGSGRRWGSSLDHKLELLLSLPLFGGTAVHSLRRLAESAIVRRLDRHELVERGARDFRVLVDGRLKLVAAAERCSDSPVLDLFDAGDVVSDPPAAAGPGGVRTAVVALERSRLLCLPVAMLDRHLEEDPALALRLLRAARERVKDTTELLAEMVSLDLSDRLYRRLVALSRRRSCRIGGRAIRIDHGLSQSELAASIAGSREAVNRQLARWRDEGLVDVGRAFVVVRDPMALAMRVSPAARKPGLCGTAEADATDGDAGTSVGRAAQAELSAAEAT